MQKYIVKDGKAVNFIEVDDGYELPEEMGVLVSPEAVEPSMLEGTPYAPPPPPVVAPPTKDELKVAAASKRYDIEVAGVTLDGVKIATDDRSKTLIMGARDKAKDDPTFTTQFKVGTGDWIDLDAPHLIAIGDAVLDHVDACFDAERKLDAAIDAGTVKTLDDIEKWNWPT